MRLIKLGHSCVRLEKDGAALVIDPGIWSGSDAVGGASAVLITHEHADHLDLAAVRAALERDRSLQLWSTAPVADQLSDLADRVHAVADGDRFEAAGFDVTVHGEQHAVVHPEIAVVPNVGFTVDGTVFHPGDSFTVPAARVPVLLLPVSAPWLKMAEVIDYAREMAPERSIALHDAVLSAEGLGLVAGLMRMLSRPGDGSFTRLEPGTTVEL